LVVFAKLQHPEMIAIVLTGYDDPVLRTEAAHAGASYLVKPIDSERLLELIDPRPALRPEPRLEPRQDTAHDTRKRVTSRPA
jgi:AmiR/NasT family two-component response regulator